MSWVFRFCACVCIVHFPHAGNSFFLLLLFFGQFVEKLKN